MTCELFVAILSGLIFPISRFLQSDWFPKELKTKLEFLNIYGGFKCEEPNNLKYAKLQINKTNTEQWLIIFPKFTFEMFSINMANLPSTTIKWVADHSNIEIDLIEADTSLQ
jgi:hypothetical protein